MTTELEKRIETLEAALTKAEDEKKAALGEKFKATTALKKLQDDQEAAIEDAKAQTGTELDKALNDIKKLTKQVTDLTGERDRFATDLRTVRVDNEIKTAIAAGKVMPEFAELVEAHLLRRVQDTDGTFTIDGKSITDATKAYLRTPTGMKTVLAPESTGSGSTGNSGAVANTWTKAPVSNAEWDAFDALEPAVRNGLADQWNMPALKV